MITFGISEVVGAVIQNSYHHYENFIGETFWTAPIVLMSVGSLIFVISFFGCCGALRESSWMILTFSVFLTLVFVTEIGIGVAGYIKHGELPGILEKQFNKTMEDYTNSVEAQHAWSLVQGELECCGIHGPTDWRPIFKNKTVPAMCCHILPEGVKHCSTDVSIIQNADPTSHGGSLLLQFLQYASKVGCLPKLLQFLENKSLFLAAVGIGIALVQLIGAKL